MSPGNDDRDNKYSTQKTSELEQIKYLLSKDTNFVFLFGKPACGKTAITASIINYLNTRCEFGRLEQTGNQTSRQLGETIRKAIAGGRFPDRTGIGNVFEVDCHFIPASNRAHLSDLWFTFLEMSGEDLSEVSVSKSGKLPSNIDVFFKAGTLSITFILVTPYNEVKDDDDLMVEFLDYINKKSPRFRNARVLLLVSKWDNSNGRISVSDFLRQQMPQTFKKLSSSTNSYGVFTLGTVVDEVDEIPYIQEYDSASAKRVFKWLYETLENQTLV